MVWGVELLEPMARISLVSGLKRCAVLFAQPPSSRHSSALFELNPVWCCFASPTCPLIRIQKAPRGTSMQCKQKRQDHGILCLVSLRRGGGSPVERASTPRRRSPYQTATRQRTFCHVMVMNRSNQYRHVSGFLQSSGNQRRRRVRRGPTVVDFFATRKPRRSHHVAFLEVTEESNPRKRIG